MKLTQQQYETLLLKLVELENTTLELRHNLTRGSMLNGYYRKDLRDVETLSAKANFAKIWCVAEAAGRVFEEVEFMQAAKQRSEAIEAGPIEQDKELTRPLHTCHKCRRQREWHIGGPCVQCGASEEYIYL